MHGLDEHITGHWGEDQRHDAQGAADTMAVTIEGCVAREVQSWGDWAKVSLDELVSRICRQWLANQERTLGNDDKAEEWLDED